MDSNLPPNQAPTQPQIPAQITPEQLEQMKAIARQRAIEQTMSQQIPEPQPQPEIVYVRRNLTVAEVIVVFIISCGLVIGVPATLNFVTNFLPRVEIKVN